MTTKYSPSDVHERRVYLGTTLVKYRRNGEEHYQLDSIIDRPIVKTGTVIYLTLIALIVGVVIWQMLLSVPQ